MQGKPSKPAAKTPARVSLLGLQPPKGSPFEGISHTNAPAQNTRIPNLTAQVQLAKARKQALTHGGLLTPEQQKAASDAGKALNAHKQAKKAAKQAPQTAPKAFPTTRPSVPTPPAKAAPLILGAPAPPPSAPASPSPPLSSQGRRGTTSPRLQAVAAQPAQGSILGGIPGKAIGAIASEINATAHDPIGGMFLPPGAQQILHHAGINVTSQVGKEGIKAGANLQRLGENTGKLNVSLLSPAQAANFPGQKTVTEQQIKELEAEKGGLGGLPNSTRHLLIEGSVQNGWPRQDVIKLVDSDLIHAYGNKPANPVIQFAKNAGSFAANQAAAPAGFVAIGDAAVQAAKGNTTPIKKIGQQFVEGTVNTLPGVGDRPFTQNLFWHPGETAQNFLLGEGAVDRLAGRVSHFAEGVPRNITPEGFAKPISRGQLSTKPIQRGIEKTRDAYVNTRNPILNAAVTNKRGEALPLLGPLSPQARRGAIARAGYHENTYNRAVAPVLAESNQIRANLMQAAKGVGKERAAALNAHLQGADAARAPFYRQVSKELGPIKGRGAAAHAKLSEKHPITEATLTSKDHAYLDAARRAATYATQTRAAMGQLSEELGGRYRAYQLPIVAAAKQGDELATRTQFLHNQWTDALAKKKTPEELSTIADQFNNALDDFTQRHADLGGTTPVYIPQEVPQTTVSKFKRESGVTATGKVPNLPATQDKLISSGQYRSTPQGISIETHRAAVLRAKVAHFNAVRDEYATKAENGGPAQPGVTYVKAENLRSPVKLENTVGEHNLTDEQTHSLVEQMRLALEGGKVDVTSGYIPAQGDILAVPTSIYNELHAGTTLPKSGTAGQLYDTANRKYQRFMLSKPSTAVANIVGNPILAAMGGAGPIDIARSYGRIAAHPEWLPPQLMGEGLGGAAGQRVASTPAGKYVNFSLSHQRASEDAARDALYHHNATPYVRKQMNVQGRSADEILKDMAAGRDPHGAIFAKRTTDFLGKMLDHAKRDPGTERMLSRGILFHRWLGHILTLTLYTMPVKYPGRAVFLQRVSEIGDDYRKHHGVYPSWYRSMIPLMQHIATNSGVPGAEAFTRVLPSGAIWPTANLPLPLADSEGANPYAAIIGSTNPVVRSALEAPTGMDWASLKPYKDSTGAAVKPGLNLGLLAGQEYRNLPYASVVTPFPGMSADAYPGHMTPAVHKNKYGSPLPPGFSTSSRPYGGSTPSLTPEYVVGALSRLFLGGSGLQDLPANTRGTNYARVASQVKARQSRNKIIREQAKARAKRKGG